MNESTLDNNLPNNENTTNYPTNANKDDLGSFFGRFFKIIYIHKWLFLSIFILVVAIVILYALQQPRSYMSSYEVFYNESVHELVSNDDNSGTVVKSDFDKNYWLRAMQSDEIMRITQKNSGLSYTSYQLSKMFLVGVVDKRKEDRIPVFLVQISSEHKEHIPVLIKSYINALNYLLLQNQVNNSQNLIAYLNGQISQNNQKLSQFDLQIDNNGIANSEIVDFDKIKASLDDFRKDLMNARVNLSAIQSARKRTEIALKNLDGTIVNESAFSEPLKVQLMNLEVDLARALTKNKDDHPAVKQIKDNIEQIKTMLKDSLEQRLEIKSLIQNPLKGQLMSKLLDLQIQEVSEETRVKSLETVIDELERKTMPNSVNQDQQQQLRNREMVSLTIKQLNDRLIETQSTSHGSLSRFVYIDDPNSIFLANKSIWFYIALALALGLIIAALIVLIYDLLDDRIMMVDDYEKFYKYPLVGSICHYSSSDDKLTNDPAQNYKYKSSNEISGLIVNLRQILKHNHIKTIVISSPDRQEGKSLASLKIATALALKKQKVLLVDMDFYSPKISSKLFAEMPKGLSNYLLDEVKMSSIIQATDVENLKVVSAGDGEGQKDLFYNDSRLVTFIEQAKKEFDVILFDTPAVMYIPDILEFFDMMDSILVIVRLRRTTRKLLDRIFKTLGGFDAKYKGVVINDLRSGKRSYSDYDYGYTYQKYSENEKKETKGRKPYKSIITIMAVLIVLFFIGIRVGLFNFNHLPFEKNNQSDTLKLPKPDTIKDTVSYHTIPDSVKPAIKEIQNQYIDSIIVTENTHLASMAFDKYGKKCFWVYIYLANKSTIKNPNKLVVGSMIYLPDPKIYDIDANKLESVSRALKLERQLKDSI